jgi:hypothetical protein|nr:MAG TPA: hypothetical protein [Caudoviricetes sp.]
MIYIEFKATGSNLRRTDLNKVVAYTQNELSARFSLNSDWDDLNPIVAVFSKDGGTCYDMVLDDNRECTVPWEVLGGKGVLNVSLVGGNTLTSTEVEINVLATGQLGGLVSQPSDTLYQQLLEKYNEVEADWESCKNLLDTYKSEVSASTSAIDATRENAVSELTQIQNNVNSLLTECKNNLSNAKEVYDKSVELLNSIALNSKYLANEGLTVGAVEKCNVIIALSSEETLSYIDLAHGVIYNSTSNSVDIYTDGADTITQLLSESAVSYINLGGVA